MIDLKARIIVALDVESTAQAKSIIDEMKDSVGAFKVGLQLFVAAGPGFVRELTSAGHKIFLDLKFHDIPNTVASAAVEATRLGVWMFNVHASGGTEMMRRTVAAVDEVCKTESLARPLIIGVTVLTSSDDATLNEIGVDSVAKEQVDRLAKLADEAGLDGVVASPQESSLIKALITRENFVVVTPGIRIKSATGDDQKRVTTLGQAIAAGSDYVVIGRPITQTADRIKALEEIIAEANV